MMSLQKLACASALVLTAGSSFGAIVAQNPWDSAATDSGAFSHLTQQLATQFALGAGASITRATWHGTMFSADPLNTGDTWSFSINVYGDTGTGTPGALLASAAVMADVTDAGFDVAGERDYLFDASFGSIGLGSGTYWLSILNTGAQNTFRWTRGTSGLDSALNIGSGWTAWTESGRTPINFTLHDDGTAVPEPGTLALVGAALTALALRRRH